MAEKPERDSSELARAWLQTLGLLAGLIASLWAGYKVFREEVLPRWAPPKVTLELTVKDGGLKGENQAIEVRIAAKNSGFRNAYLLSNAWVARGIKIGAKRDEDWLKTVEGLLAQSVPGEISRDFSVTDNTMIAASTAFTDYLLKPDEVVSASFVFFVPKDVYDVLLVDVTMPTTAVENSAETQWRVFPDGSMSYILYRLGPNGVRKEIGWGADADRQASEIGLQIATSRQSLPLWPKTPTTTEPSKTSPP